MSRMKHGGQVIPIVRNIRDLALPETCRPATTPTSPSSYLRPFDSILVLLCPFSTSPDRHFGVGGTSSGILARPRRVEECWGSLTDEGNSARRGVSAVLTLRADLRRVSFIVHSRFLATKKRVPVTTRPLSVQMCPRMSSTRRWKGPTHFREWRLPQRLPRWRRARPST